MAEEDLDGIDPSELKRPAVSLETYTQIKAIADEELAISANDVGWEKCLKVVIDEHVPNSNRKRPHGNKDYKYD